MDESIDALAAKAGTGSALAEAEIIVTPGFRREAVPAELAETPGEFA